MVHKTKACKLGKICALVEIVPVGILSMASALKPWLIPLLCHLAKPYMLADHATLFLCLPGWHWPVPENKGNDVGSVILADIGWLQVVHSWTTDWVCIFLWFLVQNSFSFSDFTHCFLIVGLVSCCPYAKSWGRCVKSASAAKLFKTHLILWALVDYFGLQAKCKISLTVLEWRRCYRSSHCAAGD